MDRTREFTDSVESFKRRQALSSSTGAPTLGVRAQKPPKSRVFVTASQIARNLGHIGINVKKLADLSKTSDPFKDCEVRIEELSGTIKLDLDTLKAQIDGLPKLLSECRNAHSRAHCEQIIEQLRMRLANVTQKMKTILTSRSEALRLQQERRDQFCATTTPSVLSHRTGGSQPYNIYSGDPALGGPAAAAASGGSDFAVALPEDDLTPLQQTQVAYHASRTQSMTRVQRTLAEIGRMFQDFTQLVYSQGEQLRIIDDNLDHTLDNLEAATGELKTAQKKISSNRWLIIKILLIIVAFLLVFGLLFR
ncbi:Syntaxin 5 [Paratrimastix pyriformis]|uniref:Syntaxin 5 n=1 Tax=Paratrimastix pyriformis TaxID=342808 RepID=A0ABQ8USI1_9EUKA|nr:Syntaxin 5 [Paratrimastix pyriformis]